MMDPPRLHLIKPKEHWEDPTNLFCSSRADGVRRSTTNPKTFEREPPRSRCPHCEHRSRTWRQEVLKN